MDGDDLALESLEGSEEESLEGLEEESSPNPLIPARVETKGTGRRGLKKRLTVRVF